MATQAGSVCKGNAEQLLRHHAMIALSEALIIRERFGPAKSVGEAWERVREEFVSFRGELVEATEARQEMNRSIRTEALALAAACIAFAADICPATIDNDPDGDHGCEDLKGEGKPA